MTAKKHDGFSTYYEGVEIVGMNVEGMLYRDPQCAKPTGMCACCGREVYSGGRLCWACREEGL